MPVLETRVLLVRHPRHGGLLRAADTAQAKSLLRSSPEPLLLVIEAHSAEAVGTNGVNLATLLELDHEVIETQSVPLLGPAFASGPTGALVDVTLEITSGMILIRVVETAELESPWEPRPTPGPISYVRRLATLAVAERADAPTTAVARRVVELIALDNRDCLALESERASTLLATSTGQMPASDDVLVLWRARHRMRQVHAVLQGRAYPESAIHGLAIDRVVTDLDSISQLLMVKSLERLALNAIATTQAVNALQQSNRSRERFVQREVRRIDRRLGAIATAFLLPSLWLAFWAVPTRTFNLAAPVDLFLVAVAVCTALLIPAGYILFSKLGNEGDPE